MKLRTTVHQVRLGRAEYRVVTAVPRAPGVVLHDGPWSLQMVVDRPGAVDLAAAWALAARSPRSLIHLPLRADAGPTGPTEPDRLDLVLLHHSLAFPPSRWKAVRRRLGAGRPHTVDIPDSDFPAEGDIDHVRRGFAGWRDELRFAGAARTLFLTGSATAFRWTGSWVRSLSTEGPAALRRYPQGAHYCITLCHESTSPARTSKGVPGQLHIEYAEGHVAGPGAARGAG
ncbi:hypothetical protein [Kitasatospora sp. NPDC050463]|uniref:hypothetical protein n=1 Tax=Kitasatospora sp. NPDC050463 TaxID=3155786 RepID=UPI0033E9324E